MEAKEAIKREEDEIRRIAEAETKAREEQLYREAKEKNTRAAWENYLREFPKAEYAFEAKSNRTKMKKVGALEWSDRSPDKMDWNAAKQYCENLTDDNYNDWRLPNIDELRSLIQNCPKTEDGGECKVSEVKCCLSSKKCKNKCPGSGDCEYKPDNVGYYSRFGDHGIGLWSSSSSSDATDSAWFVDFERGEVSIGSKSMLHYVRCVRGTREVSDLKGGSEKKESKPKPDIPKTQDKAAEVKSEPKKSSSRPKVVTNPVPGESRSSTHDSFSVPRPVEDKPVQRKTWSSRSPHAMTWKQAVAYCKNLEEDGVTDWRLPNIDELRKLVRNCPQTQTNGSCEVSQKNNCLSLRCSEPEGSCGCDRKSGNVGYYSKLGDNSETWLWSSSTRSDNPEYAWILSFLFGGVYNNVKVFNVYVRCIR